MTDVHNVVHKKRKSQRKITGHRVDEIKAQQFCCHQLFQRHCIVRLFLFNASFGLQYLQLVDEFELYFVQVSVETTLMAAFLGEGGWEPGRPVTVTAGGVGQVAVSSAAPSRTS